MLTPETLPGILKHFCPRAKESYVTAISDPGWGIGMMQRFGILENKNRLACFLPNGFHETGALTIECESLKYKSTDRLRKVWPSRFGKKSDAELAHLIHDANRNPDGDKHLAAAVYNSRIFQAVVDVAPKGKQPSYNKAAWRDVTDEALASPDKDAYAARFSEMVFSRQKAYPAGSVVIEDRMGNRPGTFDGYFYCGRGFLQVTGRSAYLKYGSMLGIDFDAKPEYVLSMPIMFAMSCAEVGKEGLNAIADAGNFDGYSAKLNTGSAANVKGCVGLADRKAWFGKVSAWLNENPGSVGAQPAALAAYDANYHPDGDTAPGQTEHWTDLEEDEDDEEEAA